MTELTVFSTHAAYDVLAAVGPRFERDTGNKLTFRYDPAKAVRRQVEEGAVFDVAIITRPVFDALAEKGHILPETRADLGRSGLGVSVRQGAPKPDIGTVDAFKHALLSAKSVVRSTEGTSGMYFEQLLGELGIAKDMQSKIVLGPSGRVAELVARGEGELAVQQVPELLPVKGTDFVGPFPEELQLYSTFCAGVGAKSKNRDAAKAFIAALTTPAAATLFKAAGLEPVA